MNEQVRAFQDWWLSEGIKQMPHGDEPSEHAAIAELAWNAALASTPPVPASERELREVAQRFVQHVTSNGNESQEFANMIGGCMECLRLFRELERLLSRSGQPMAASNQLACASCSTVMVADGIPGQLYCPKCQPSRSGQPSTSERDLDVCVAAVCEALNVEAVLRSGQEQPPFTRCGESAGHFAGASYFACVLDKGHQGDHRRGGNCFKHGEYVGNQCPDWPNCAFQPAARQKELRERFRNLRERANGWTEADLRKHPIATLELIDALANGLIEALERIGYTVRPAAAQGKEQPQVEPIRKELMARFSNKLSMDEIANCAYALAAALQPPARLAAEQIAGMIETEVSYFNGWAVSYESMKHACLKAAKAIHAALAAHGTVPARLTAEQVREALNIERTPDLVEQVTKRLNAAQRKEQP